MLGVSGASARGRVLQQGTERAVDEKSLWLRCTPGKKTTLLGHSDLQFSDFFLRSQVLGPLSFGILTALASPARCPLTSVLFLL